MMDGSFTGTTGLDLLRHLDDGSSGVRPEDQVAASSGSFKLLMLHKVAKLHPSLSLVIDILEHRLNSQGFASQQYRKIQVLWQSFHISSKCVAARSIQLELLWTAGGWGFSRFLLVVLLFQCSHLFQDKLKLVNTHQASEWQPQF